MNLIAFPWCFEAASQVGFVPLSSGEILGGVAVFILVTIVSFGLFTLLSSYVRFQLLSGQADVALLDGSMEPKKAFELQVARQVAASQKSRKTFSVLLVEPLFRGGVVIDDETMDDARGELDKELRKQLRSHDVVVPFRENLLGLMVKAGPANLESLAQRLVREVHSSLAGTGSLLTGCRIGCSSWPNHGQRMAELMNVAQRSVESAPAQGNACYNLGPEVRKADDEDAVEPHIDARTGLLKPEYLLRGLQRYVSRYRRARLPVTVITLSVDFREKYLLHYGREGMEQVDGQLAQMFSSNTRLNDFVATHPSGSFVLALQADLEQGVKIAARLTERVRKTAFKVERSDLKVTVSGGAAACPDHGSHAGPLLKGAEKAMKSAVNHGGGMVMAYDPGAHRTVAGEKPADSF